MNPLFYSMEHEAVLEALKQQIQPALDELNAEIVEITLKRASKKLILRLLVDKAGGINLDECALINKRIGHIIEENALIEDRHVVEVFSPGLDRVLRTEDDFKRAKGAEIEAWFSGPVEGEIYLEGKVEAAGAEDLILENKDARQFRIRYSIITKARLKI
ncbi:MAG: hypothetical protein HQ558_07490 [Candidatus Omnitrophica bacterium]|nr:hypothetical protein [Candidatus Omnitrophota bacterium]